MRFKSAVSALAIGGAMLLLVAIGGSFTANRASAQTAVAANPTILSELQILKNQLNALQPRTFYLTTTAHDGLNAPAACASGFHMASLWEVFDPTYLRYDRTRGFIADDAGSGPPANHSGWIRTGSDNQTGGGPGDANCNSYTSNNVGEFGTGVQLTEEWAFDDRHSGISPWDGSETGCNLRQPVWCMRD